MNFRLGFKKILLSAVCALSLSNLMANDLNDEMNEKGYLRIIDVSKPDLRPLQKAV